MCCSKRPRQLLPHWHARGAVPWKASFCHETHLPSERTVYCFSACQRLGSRPAGACPDCVSGDGRGPGRPHTRLAGRPARGARLPRPRGRGDRAPAPSPPPGRGPERAAWSPGACASPAWARGSPRAPVALCTGGLAGRRIPCRPLRPAGPCATIAYQQVGWAGGRIHYQRCAGDGLQPPLRSRLQPRLTRGVRRTRNASCFGLKGSRCAALWSYSNWEKRDSGTDH
jgi:hypothetical protein